MSTPSSKVVIIGAGIGGLAAALRLSHQGCDVTVLDMHDSPGGKMRTMPSAAGPVDAGPTVLTMRPVFEELFADVEETLADHLTLKPLEILARHYWDDGASLDLTADKDQSRDNIVDAFGIKAAAEFTAFSARAKRLFDAFDAPMMQTAAPALMSMTAQMLRRPGLIPAMAPHRSLAQNLSRLFTEPKLAQLFGRYATYVGGRPDASPALLSLIWQAESRGVWHVTGGMHQLAEAIAARAAALGATFHYGAEVTDIDLQDGRPSAVVTAAGRTAVDAFCFNGDPRALATGLLGDAASHAVAKDATTPRSLSACVHSFAAKAEGVPLAAHNVFFCADPKTEFDPIAQGHLPQDATLYLCAQDRFDGHTPTQIERFEIIMNAPAVGDHATLTAEEKTTCHQKIMARLQTFGLRFSPMPEPQTLTMPQGFAALFPASNGALYGRSPHGMTAAFKRPTVRSRLPGLYLGGGGVHPGAGIPMATLCGAHAAAAMISDLALSSPRLQADTPGGTSTASPTMAAAPSPSSAS